MSRIRSPPPFVIAENIMTAGDPCECDHLETYSHISLQVQLMPQYSLDVDDGHATLSIPAGGQATSPEVARDEAVRLLTEMAKAKIIEGDEHLLVGVVKDDASRAIYRVLLTLTCTKLA